MNSLQKVFIAFYNFFSPTFLKLGSNIVFSIDQHLSGATKIMLFLLFHCLHHYHQLHDDEDDQWALTMEHFSLSWKLIICTI